MSLRRDAIAAIAVFLVATTTTIAAAQSAPAMPIGPAERVRVVGELATRLANDYFDPDTGARYAAMLRDNMAAGRYDGETDATEFASALTRDLLAVAADSHLRVGLKASFDRPRPAAADAPASTRPSGPRGLEEARMLGEVAYLRFNAFPDEPASAQAARAFLVSHTEARAVVIDSRPNRGGGMVVMNAILPLLYAERSTQVRMDLRVAPGADPGFDPDSTLVVQPSPPTLQRFDHVIEPDAIEKRLQHVPVYYLTSRRTGSAAEHLALGFKRNHRATLIGETTAGANHFGATATLDERFMVFVPVGRSYDPATGLDWEGTGVAPDRPTHADRALDEALALAAAAGMRVAPLPPRP